ncbi:MAG: T9SS type A sorting domain-containing protein, partial [Cryomorphaceae bacterium]
GMHIAGSFNGFTPEAMTDAGDGVFTFTAAIESGTTATWKYLNGATFDGQETVPADCGADDGFGGFNRSLEVPETDTTLEVVCFSSCEACEDPVEPGEEVNVTFFVDMSLETIDAQGVGISGSFNDFAFQEMTDQGAGLYSFTIALESGQTYDYKFRNGEAFENPPAACGPGDFNNRQVTPGEVDLVLDPVCYAACEACSDPVEPVTLTLQVDASQIDVDPTGIHLAGSFNGFTPEPMDFGGNDIYTLDVEVEPGAAVTWKFLNGDNFDNAESVPTECGEPDGFGGFNRSFDMPASDFVFDAVCFGSCTACETVVDDVTVTFQVNTANLIIVPSEGIHIAGNFNGFTPEAMTDAGDGIYTFEAQVEPGTTLLWKYLNGSSFDDQETVPEECGEDDGFGGFNRIFLVPALDQVIEVVCFDQCEDCVPDFVQNTGKRENFTLFPNPNNGDFSIVAPASGAVDLRIFDLTGRLIHANRFLTVEGDVVDYTIATPENGYYIVELRYDQKFYGTRIVVQK